MTDEKVIDILTRKPVQMVNTPEGETAQQFMRRWAKSIKDGKFNNIAIIVMDENNHCDYGVIAYDELQLSLFAHLVSDVKKQLLAQLFGTDTEEEDEWEE